MADATSSSVSTTVYTPAERTSEGVFLRRAALLIVTLTQASDNKTPHGLPAAPVKVQLVPRNGNGNFYEEKAADKTNIYIHSGSSGPTSVMAYVEY